VIFLPTALSKLGSSGPALGMILAIRTSFGVPGPDGSSRLLACRRRSV